MTKEEKKIAESNGISYYTVYSRINESGMSIEEAITTPLGICKERKHGKWTKIALENGILESTFYSRLKLGWGYEEAATKPAREMNTMNEWLEIAKRNGIKRNTFYTRIYHQKLDLETAATRPVINVGRRCSMRGKEGVS
nr:nucleoside permease [Bacillus cereus]